jgi:hypothetical protein
MPIKPENKHRYPKNWPEIRERTRQRAGNKCEQCKVQNHSFICRGRWNGIDVYQDDNGAIFSAADGRIITQNYVGDLEGNVRFIKVVCTTAHLDHNPENNVDTNLRFWCQRCHNRYDRKHRDHTIKESKLKGQLTLTL